MTLQQMIVASGGCLCRIRRGLDEQKHQQFWQKLWHLSERCPGLPDPKLHDPNGSPHRTMSFVLVATLAPNCFAVRGNGPHRVPACVWCEPSLLAERPGHKQRRSQHRELRGPKSRGNSHPARSLTLHVQTQVINR